MTWKDRALQAVDTKAAQEREAQRQRDDAEQVKQIEAFGFALRTLLEEDITVDALQVAVDGVIFQWTPNPITRKWGIVMQGVCPECGETDWSGHIDNLEQLGKLLRDFAPESGHAKKHRRGRNTPMMGYKSP